MDEIISLLESMTSDSLNNLLKAIDMKYAGLRKNEKINALIDFYKQKDFILKIWEYLDPVEKAILTVVVQCNYEPYLNDFKKIDKEFGEGSTEFFTNRYHYGYSKNVSKLMLIRINGKFPDFIKKEIKRLNIIPPLAIKFNPVKDKDVGISDDYYGRIIDRASRISDFDKFIQFVNTSSVQTTKAIGFINKKSLIKFYDLVKYEEVFNNDDDVEMEDIKNAKETTVSIGLIQLLLNANVLAIQSDKYILGENATYFVGLDNLAKASFLYDHYIVHNNLYINECERITAEKYLFTPGSWDFREPIEIITTYLAKCPKEQWIDIKEFANAIRKNHLTFLSNIVGNVTMRDDYYNQYFHETGFYTFEYHFIEVVLMEYLAVLGAVDVLVDLDWDDYGSRCFLSVAYFRVTKLGEYLLGLNPDFVLEEKSIGSATGFIVQPNFEIIIPNGPQRLTHELYFDRFLEKTVKDEQVTIYKLDFKGMVKALEVDLNIEEIYEYIKNCATEAIPENVSFTFSDFIKNSKRIFIRTITVIETDDEFLLEEIKNYSGVKKTVKKVLKNAIEIDKNQILKVKREIEKNKRFVQVEMESK